MRCSHCGSGFNRLEAKFCRDCGKPMLSPQEQTIVDLLAENASLRTELTRQAEVARRVVEAGGLPKPVYGDSPLRLLRALWKEYIESRFPMVKVAAVENKQSDLGCLSCGAPDGNVCAEKCPDRIARAKAAAGSGWATTISSPQEEIGKLAESYNGLVNAQLPDADGLVSAVQKTARITISNPKISKETARRIARQAMDRHLSDPIADASERHGPVYESYFANADEARKFFGLEPPVDVAHKAGEFAVATREQAKDLAISASNILRSHGATIDLAGAFAAARADCSCVACQNTHEVPHAPGCPWHKDKR